MNNSVATTSKQCCTLHPRQQCKITSDNRPSSLSLSLCLITLLPRNGSCALKQELSNSGAKLAMHAKISYHPIPRRARHDSNPWPPKACVASERREDKLEIGVGRRSAWTRLTRPASIPTKCCNQTRRSRGVSPAASGAGGRWMPRPPWLSSPSYWSEASWVPPLWLCILVCHQPSVTLSVPTWWYRGTVRSVLFKSKEELYEIIIIKI